MSNRNLKLVENLTDAELQDIQAEIDDKKAADIVKAADSLRTGEVLPPVGAFTLDDLSNARRFIELCGSDILYLAEAKKWLYWNGTHWAFDQTNFVFDMACEFVTTLYAPENIQGNEAAFKHAKRSNNASGLEAMLKIVRNKLTVTTDDLDQQPDLFNCLSGTIDLPSGEVRQHDRNDRITKISPFHYNPDAECGRFLDFLTDIQPNPMIRDYLQQALGYSMSATYSDRAFFILYGFGRNGKSVFVDLFSRIFGNYSQNTTADSLMRRSGQSIPNDIARLRGSRFITCNETEEGKQLNESLLKAMTGGDSITARFLFGEFFDFYFSGKIWIVTNHKPKIIDTSQGFWDRLKLIPFTTQIEKEKQIDKDLLLSQLLDEASGILAWTLDGYRKYYEHRQLVEPEAIKAEVATYKFEQDSIAQFIKECCEVWTPIENETEPSTTDRVIYSAANPDVYSAYRKYCEQNGEPPRSQRRLSQNLIERGFSQMPKNGVRVWTGFKLID